MLPETNIIVLNGMHNQCETRVRCAAGTSGPFVFDVGFTIDIEIIFYSYGFTKGFDFSPFLFVILIDSLIENIVKEASCQMMFVDDVMLCEGEHPEHVLDVELMRCGRPWRKGD